MEYKNITTNPVAAFLKLVGAKWKVLVIRELLKSDLRFVELKKKLGCTSKVLTVCLRELEKDGLVVREEQTETQLKVIYYLTDIGYTLQPVINSIEAWGKDYKKLKKLMEKQNLINNGEEKCK